MEAITLKIAHPHVGRIKSPHEMPREESHNVAMLKLETSECFRWRQNAGAGLWREHFANGRTPLCEGAGFPPQPKCAQNSAGSVNLGGGNTSGNSSKMRHLPCRHGTG